MKYNIIIEAMSLESFPFTASGTINGHQISLQTISHPTGILWKLVENGQVAVPLSQSDFGRGERSSIARWAKEVELNQELIGKSSQSAGSTPSTSRNSKLKDLEEQNATLKAEIAEMKEMLAALVAQKNEE